MNTTDRRLESLGMPLFGVGTWSGLEDTIDDDTVSNAVFFAIKNGYRLIDCALVYGNQKAVGKGIKRALDELDGVTREDLFIVGKLWNTQWGHVADAARLTLEQLGLEYMDLFITHWPVPFDSAEPHEELFPRGEDGEVIINEEMTIDHMWRQMIAIKEDGLTRHIGVSNFLQHHFKEIIDAGLTLPEVDQIELSPALRNRELVNFLQEHGVAVMSYSTLGGGSRSNLLEHEVLKTLSAKHSCGPANIILAWAIQNDFIVIPKSSKEHRIISNKNDSNIILDAEDLEAIETMDDENARTLDGEIASWIGRVFPAKK
ncbi:hypothetical protein PCE1_002263 [Barthelona sp. PCE]